MWDPRIAIINDECGDDTVAQVEWLTRYKVYAIEVRTVDGEPVDAISPAHARTAARMFMDKGIRVCRLATLSMLGLHLTLEHLQFGGPRGTDDRRRNRRQHLG